MQFLNKEKNNPSQAAGIILFYFSILLYLKWPF